MAIDRLRSPYNNLLAVKGDVGPSAYSNAQVGGTTPFNFVGDGSTNTIVGVTYRCHVFEYTSGQNYSITFNRAGTVDLLVVAGGAGGGGYNAAGHAGCGGGGGGGVLLQYGYGVTASTYALTVGRRGDGTSYALTPLNPRTGQTPIMAQNSVFGALTAVGGGRGSASYNNGANLQAQSGGSGGGGGSESSPHNGTPGGATGTVGQGHDGGDAGPVNGTHRGGGGGGGYISAGTSVVSTSTPGDGGEGLNLNFTGTLMGIGAGGGGGSGMGGTNPLRGSGGTGGGANGGLNGTNAPSATGRGCGGGGCGATTLTGSYWGGDGSDGIVVVRYALG